MKNTLPGLKLNKWNQYEKFIRGSENTVTADESLVLVKNAFELSAKVNKFSIADEDTLYNLKVVCQQEFVMIC